MADSNATEDASGRMGRSYGRVLLVWLVTLLALYAFHAYYS